MSPSCSPALAARRAPGHDAMSRPRFGGRELGESELREMNVALGATRRMLKARP